MIPRGCIRTATSACRRLSTSSTAALSRTMTRDTAPTSPGSSPATATTRAASTAGAAPDASLVSLKVLDAEGSRHDQQHHRGARLGAGESSPLQHPRCQPVGRCEHQRVVLDRPVDAGGQARRRRGRSSWLEPPVIGARMPTGADPIRRHHGAGQRALGADRRRVQHERHAGSRRRCGREFQLARAYVPRLCREAGPPRSRPRHRLAGRSAQRVLYHQSAISAAAGR